MFDPFTLALIGAGVGGGLSLLRGEDLGGSLKNAAIGGTLGYAGGSFLPSAFGATPAAASSAGAEAAGAAMLQPTLPMDAYAPSLLTGSAPTAYNTASMMPMIAQAPAQGGLAATQTAAPSFFDGMSDYMTPQNVLGAANALNQPSSAPQMVSGGGGGVRGGQAPSMEEIRNLLNNVRVQELVNRRRFA